jgi:hypothetical protein
MGVANKVAQEFQDTGRTAKILDSVLKLTQFKRVDMYGKKVLLNSSMRKYKKMVTSNADELDRFRDKYKDAFTPDELNRTVTAMRDGKLTKEVKFVLWNDLSDVQPVSLAEMPLAYLNHPNGRMLYALKSFTLKQFDIIRRDSLRDISNGNVTKGVFNLSKIVLTLTLANASTESIKNFILGKDVDFGDAVHTNIWKNFGLSDYLVRKAGEGKVTETIGNMVFPTGLFDLPFSMASMATDGDENTSALAEGAKNLPVFGRVFNYWFGDGLEKYHERQEREAYAD